MSSLLQKHVQARVGRPPGRPLTPKIANQSAQRRLIERAQHLAQPDVAGSAGREVLPIGLPQRGNERVAVFPADLAVPVAVAIIEAGLSHGVISPSEDDACAREAAKERADVHVRLLLAAADGSLS